MLERGIRYADGTTERVQLGRFRVDAVTWTELEGEATLTLNDRMAQIADEPFPFPYAPAGLKPSDAIVAIVQQVFAATIGYHVTTNPAAETALADVTYDQDRTAAISDLAASIGAEAYFDTQGDFVLRPRPRAGDPVWTIDAGADGVLVESTESLDRSSIRNGVAVRGQDNATQAPIYSARRRQRPRQPDPLGRPVRESRADLQLDVDPNPSPSRPDRRSTCSNLRLGLARNLTVTGIPNPALEPGDVIEIVHADGRSEHQLVNALRLGLDVTGALELATKSSYRPQTLQLEPQQMRVFAGATAWQELADAQLVEA